MKLTTILSAVTISFLIYTAVATTEDNWTAPARASAKKNPTAGDAASICLLYTSPSPRD